MSINKNEIVSTVKDLVSSVKQTTEKRLAFFKMMKSFTYDSDQWYVDEIKEKEAKNDPALTFNFAEDFVEEYLARLFPRNPKTGVMEVGVKVEDDEKKSEYENAILSSYFDNNLFDILLEQGQDYLVGGAACLFYPLSFGEAEIISLNPAEVYLGWRGRKLKWFAYYDDDENLIFYGDRKKIAVDKNDNLVIYEDFEFDFLPFSWIPCLPKPHTREGRSKVNSIWDLNREYNQRMSDFSARVIENTEPHRAVFSDTADESKIRRGRGKTTVLAKGDDMKNMELKEGQEILNYIDKVDQKIRNKIALVDKSGVVRTALSGLSLSYQYSGMMDRIAFMRVHWDRAFRELNNAILNYKFGAGSYKTDPVYHPSLVFDSKERTEEYKIMRDMDVISRRDVIEELRGAENSDKKLEEIKKEKQDFASLNVENK